MSSPDLPEPNPRPGGSWSGSEASDLLDRYFHGAALTCPACGASPAVDRFHAGAADEAIGLECPGCGRKLFHRAGDRIGVPPEPE